MRGPIDLDWPAIMRRWGAGRLRREEWAEDERPERYPGMGADGWWTQPGGQRVALLRRPVLTDDEVKP